VLGVVTPTDDLFWWDESTPGITISADKRSSAISTTGDTCARSSSVLTIPASKPTEVTVALDAIFWYSSYFGLVSNSHTSMTTDFLNGSSNADVECSILFVNKQGTNYLGNETKTTYNTYNTRIEDIPTDGTAWFRFVVVGSKTWQYYSADSGTTWVAAIDTQPAGGYDLVAGEYRFMHADQDSGATVSTSTMAIKKASGAWVAD
jgi:hypothetical protein